MGKIYDKNRREIMVGDVLKVFHFIGPGREHHYMYKQVMGITYLGSPKNPYFEISHLDLSDDKYHILLDESILDGYEIVQGFGEYGIPFEDRPKLREAPND